MRIDLLLCNGEILTYYGDMKITDGTIEIKRENPEPLVKIPLMYVDGYRREADAENNITRDKR